MPNYSVRLMMTLTADSPAQAAPTFITFLVENGMTDWVYQVCDENNEVVGYFNGYGLEVDINDLPSGPEQKEPSQEQTPVQTDEDTNLLAYAQDLNDADRTPPESPTEPVEPAEASKEEESQPPSPDDPPN